jgi:hypothetical protein
LSATRVRSAVIAAVLAASLAPIASAQSAPETRRPPPYFLLHVVDQNVTIRVMRPVTGQVTPVFSGALTGQRQVAADGTALIRVRGTGRVGIGLNVIEIGEQGVTINGAPLLDQSATLNPDGTVSPGAGTRPPG